MSHTPLMPGWSLSPEQAQYLDQVCTAFEAAWQAGERPDLEVWLRNAATGVRPALLRELLVLDRDYRRQAGERPTPDEYLARWPEDAAAIRQVFQLRPDDPDPAGMGSSQDAPTRPASDPAAAPVKESWPHLPGYEILEELGRGGMGVVYQARQFGAKRLVALKMIRDGALAGPGQRARFRVETEAAARCQHPNLVCIYEVGEHAGLSYFSMELAEGGSLDRKLNGQPYAPRAAAELVRTLAEAVHYAHEKKIIHRDLKPANVVLTSDGRPLITDFGLAKRLDRDTALTPSEAVLGTASYMAPEQAAGRAKQVGPAADIYALGAILYELLTGWPPFRGDSWAAIIEQVLHDDPEPPSRRWPGLPAELEVVCLKCLEKEPAQRYASAHALADDLGRFLAGESVLAVPVNESDRQARWARTAGFEVEEVLTYGVRDVVYKALQVHLERTVALKVITAPAQADPAARDRLRHEATMLAKLDHPNIVRIYESRELHGGRAYLAFEYLAGGSLIERFVDQPVLPREAARLVQQLAEALHYAHQRNVLHCALKPSNVLLTADGVPKITNFGLSILLEQPEAERRLAFRRLPSYMAPELAEGRTADVGPATDVYALGAILYKLLTGGPPFLADSIEATLAQVRSQPPPTPSSVQANVPPVLDAICLHCLEKEPGRRYASAGQLGGDLERFLAGAAAASPSHPREGPFHAATGLAADDVPVNLSLPAHRPGAWGRLVGWLTGRPRKREKTS